MEVRAPVALPAHMYPADLTEARDGTFDSLDQRAELGEQVHRQITEIVMGSRRQDHDDRQSGRLGQRCEEPMPIAPDHIGGSLLAAPALRGILIQPLPIRFRGWLERPHPSLGSRSRHQRLGGNL